MKDLLLSLKYYYISIIIILVVFVTIMLTAATFFCTVFLIAGSFDILPTILTACTLVFCGKFIFSRGLLGHLSKRQGEIGYEKVLKTTFEESYCIVKKFAGFNETEKASQLDFLEENYIFLSTYRKEIYTNEKGKTIVHLYFGEGMDYEKEIAKSLKREYCTRLRLYWQIRRPSGEALAIQRIRGWRQNEKQSFTTLLFNLCVMDDGIKDDEWNALQLFMRQIKLAPKIVNALNESWSPLRSRAYEQQQRQNQQATSTATPNEKLYNALGLTSSASIEDVRRAYHKLALEYHPDLAKNTERKNACEHKMAEINEAYRKITALK